MSIKPAPGQCWSEGRIAEVAAYCEVDIVITYAVWLHYQFFRGGLSREEFLASKEGLQNYLTTNAEKRPTKSCYRRTMRDVLTKEELAFLKSQGLTAAHVFDARGWSSYEWKRRVREENKILVFGNPCQRGGHRFRTRSGHCAQCDTSKIAYQQRFKRTDFVYIARSLSAKVIGSCVDCTQREGKLRNERYAGISDWRMLFYIKVQKAGEVEDWARASLHKYLSARRYDKDGSEQLAQEVLACSFARALTALSKAIVTRSSDPWMSQAHKQYNFSASQTVGDGLYGELAKSLSFI